MPRNNVTTATVRVGDTGYEKLPVFASNILNILATGRDLYICTGQPNVEAATDARAFFLPVGASLEMAPVPLSEIYVKVSDAGNISLWYA